MSRSSTAASPPSPPLADSATDFGRIEGHRPRPSPKILGGLGGLADAAKTYARAACNLVVQHGMRDKATQIRFQKGLVEHMWTHLGNN
jgi:hypothetical protein